MNIIILFKNDINKNKDWTMHKYSGVDVISLDNQQIKTSNGTTNTLLVKKEDEQKKYSIVINDGENFSMINRKKKFIGIYFVGTTNILTITIDESFENIRSGSTGIIISLPKQKHLSYLLKFSNQEGE